MKKRRLVYVSSNISSSEYIYSGIEFSEFIKYLKDPIENILLIKSDYMGNENLKGFELILGKKEIRLLAKEDIYSFGDFCFVDCSNIGGIDKLTDQEIAGLLFLGHMFRPLDTPFLEKMNNRFAYLAHDDGFFCKLYCRERSDFLDILAGKIIDMLACEEAKDMEGFDEDIKNKLLQFTEDGILFDFCEFSPSDANIAINTYLIGKFTDIDHIINNYQEYKANASSVKQLLYNGTRWIIN